MRGRRVLWGMWCGIMAMGLGCTERITTEFPDGENPKLVPIQSAKQWKEFFSSQVDARQDGQALYPCSNENGVGVAVDAMEPPGDAAQAEPTVSFDDADSSNGAESAGGDFTRTNIQEVGVDESDVVKTDGEFLYVLSDSELKIVRAVPADAMEEVSSIPLGENSYNHQLYLNGDRVVVVYQRQEFDEPFIKNGDNAIELAMDGDIAYPDMYMPSRTVTVVTLINVSDTADALIEAEWQLDGMFNTSRMIDGVLHLVLSQYPDFYGHPMGMETARWTDADYLQMVPQYSVTFADGTESTGMLVGWEDFYRPEQPDGFSITTIFSLNTDQPTDEFHSVAVMADTGIVYASQEAIYLTDPDYSWYCGPRREELRIHKLRFTDHGAEYVASGMVEGRLLNQFSLGEHNGHLRLATTTGYVGGWSDQVAHNHIFVLGEQEDVLEVVGSIRDVAPNEQIYSARFVGDRGFLVTFRNIDPLFTLDLSEPTQPAVVGELKVPGYSDYIHILDENHLLTLGKAARGGNEDFAWYQGVQLSIFDVSDFAKPQLVTSKEIGTRGTNSEANHNHKAFTFNRSNNILAIPIQLHEKTRPQYDEWEYGELVFAGVQFYHISVEEGITFKGQISTAPISEYGYSYYWGWTRGLFIGDYVYAVTSALVKSALVDSPSDVIDTLEISDDPYGEYPDRPLVDF